MNHDMCHCQDYDKKKCPQTCSRARLTADYFKLSAEGKIDFFTTWSHFEGKEYCEKAESRKEE